MESDIKRLACYRNSVRTHHHTMKRLLPKADFEETSSIELLEKIVSNLPESQKPNFEKFENVLRQNSHSPQNQRKVYRRATYAPSLAQRNRLDLEKHF